MAFQQPELSGAGRARSAGQWYAVVERLLPVREKEAKMLANIKAGQRMPAWVDEALAAKGCELLG